MPPRGGFEGALVQLAKEVVLGRLLILKSSWPASPPPPDSQNFRMICRFCFFLCWSPPRLAVPLPHVKIASSASSSSPSSSLLLSSLTPPRTSMTARTIITSHARMHVRTVRFFYITPRPRSIDGWRERKRVR